MENNTSSEGKILPNAVKARAIADLALALLLATPMIIELHLAKPKGFSGARH